MMLRASRDAGGEEAVLLTPDRPAIAEAAAVLTRAFHDDPGMAYVFPEEAARRKRSPWCFRMNVRYALRYGGLVHTTAAGIRGVAVWLPPGGFRVRLRRLVALGVLAAPFRVGAGALLRLRRLGAFHERRHELDVAPRHWYLLTLGVDPAHQGRGIGGTLLRPVLSRADAEGLPAYLETAKERNVAFYRRYRFAVVSSEEVTGGGPRFFTMRRPPGGA